ncbi:hypothetical protein JCM10212_001759 [Sporobolomyces blumeae]
MSGRYYSNERSLTTPGHSFNATRQTVPFTAYERTTERGDGGRVTYHSRYVQGIATTESVTYYSGSGGGNADTHLSRGVLELDRPDKLIENVFVGGSGAVYASSSSLAEPPSKRARVEDDPEEVQTSKRSKKGGRKERESGTSGGKGKAKGQGRNGH